MSELFPTKLHRTQTNSLVIEWSDGIVHEVPLRDLRKACPCARCRAEELQPQKPRALLPVLDPAQARPLAIERMTPVGNYAYSIEFSDGHSTGIYSFEFLRRIGDQAAGKPT
jgi:DUF971 family protein